MKYTFTILLLLILKCTFSQGSQKGRQYFSIGIGESAIFNNILENQISDAKSKTPGILGKFYFKSTPSIFGKFEKSLDNKLNVGVVVGYRKTTITQVIDYYVVDSTYKMPTWWGGYQYNYKQITKENSYTYTNLSLGIRMNYYFIEDKKIDPYIGMAAGFRLVSFNQDIIYPTNSNILTFETRFPIYLAATIGARYFITNGIGIYAELGLDKWSVIQGGLVFKI